MEWVFDLYREPLRKASGIKKGEPDAEAMKGAFKQALDEGSIKVLVQEPWMGTIRFKTLAVHEATSDEAEKLFRNPMEYLREKYGGGKYKINFYHGMNFMATKNFKPEGEPLWRDLPEFDEEL